MSTKKDLYRVKIGVVSRKGFNVVVEEIEDIDMCTVKNKVLENSLQSDKTNRTYISQLSTSVLLNTKDNSLFAEKLRYFKCKQDEEKAAEKLLFKEVQAIILSKNPHLERIDEIEIEHQSETTARFRVKATLKGHFIVEGKPGILSSCG